MRHLTSGLLVLALAAAAAADPAPPARAKWVDQLEKPPSPEEIAALRDARAAAPRDRTARNKLCYALQRGGAWAALLEEALDWKRFDARNPQVYEYLGVAWSNLGDDARALRALSSLADVAPKDSGIQNRAAYLALAEGHVEMAAHLFREALEVRPDHQNNHRGLGLALWSQGRYADAMRAYAEALGQEYHPRYIGAARVIREEAAAMARAWMRAEPGKAASIGSHAEVLELDLERRDALRISLHWETDANDVDLHVVDPAGEECFYGHKENASGVRLYADLTQGLGPEVIVVPPGKLAPGTYHVGVKYYSAGPMGTARGIVLVERPSDGPLPDVQVHPFTLLPDDGNSIQDMRYVLGIEVGAAR